MRRLLLVPALALAATAALAAPAGAGDQEHRTADPIPRLAAATFPWAFPRHETDFRIGRSAMTNACSPSDGRSFRERGRGFQAEIYLGPAAPASARAQISAILDSWRVS